MALITAQQLTNYYNQFAEIDVTFTKEVLSAIHLRSKDIYIRALGSQWPCIVYSSSMTGAKIIANVDNDLAEKVREANNLASLYFSFDQPDKKTPATFFISAKAAEFSTYSDERPELNFITLKYTQRPSDDFIGTLGTLLDANINAKRRKEERIEINPETLRKLGLASKNAMLFVNDVPRNCIVRDLSFTGASILITGVGKFLIDKDAKLKLEIKDSKSQINLTGKIVRFDEVPDRKGIGSVAIDFNENEISMDYKLRVNDYLSTSRKPDST
jgi:hypothetical protein